MTSFVPQAQQIKRAFSRWINFFFSTRSFSEARPAPELRADTSHTLARLSFHPPGPREKTQQFPARVPHETEHIPGSQRLRRLARIGLNAPSQKIASPGHQPMTASRIPDKAQWGKQGCHPLLSISAFDQSPHLRLQRRQTLSNVSIDTGSRYTPSNIPAATPPCLSAIAPPLPIGIVAYYFPEVTILELGNQETSDNFHENNVALIACGKLSSNAFAERTLRTTLLPRGIWRDTCLRKPVKQTDLFTESGWEWGTARH